MIALRFESEAMQQVLPPNNIGCHSISDIIALENCPLRMGPKMLGTLSTTYLFSCLFNILVETPTQILVTKQIF